MCVLCVPLPPRLLAAAVSFVRSAELFYSSSPRVVDASVAVVIIVVGVYIVTKTKTATNNNNYGLPFSFIPVGLACAYSVYIARGQAAERVKHLDAIETFRFDWSHKRDDVCSPPLFRRFFFRTTIMVGTVDYCVRD